MQDYKYNFTVTNKQKKVVLLVGTMDNPKKEFQDPNIGNFATFKSTTKRGMDLMKKLVNEALVYGMLAYIPHDCVETQVHDGYRVVSVTGEGDDGKGLATHFQLFYKDEEVAHCHMTYCDGSQDPSLGPTIKKIAVKQSRHGKGLAKVLWYWVHNAL